ncbi:MAG: PD-(D/E)XK nuclease family protein [Kiritimatiellae bacterium]|nr:PD-(D/E)XK nuclease family protein [Verrucomicrobiota bacterium]MBU4286149.1 PD-(D/E)XK nuclease family protein [Verrucomicrobiota bacterium]MBU4366100.1 PD-(D/E)XK nuclease family protein [Verrucomicrobiota bacterium]MCG2660518.1 PD-(D/E)XK nuclease family protein [Kiritimatiellia bacterium]
MADLINTFSWSISARADFEECPRRRFLAKYAMWGGWKADAPSLTRAAYRLGKMENRFTLQGNAVERAVMWALRQTQAEQAGKPVTATQAYETVVKPYLNQCWNESKKKLWQANPKKHCCLHEHYYPAHHHTPEADMTARMIEQIKRCLANFLEQVMPRLGSVRPEQEVEIAHADGGDPESFLFESIKVYAIPDYAYRQEDHLHIHDWKAGSEKPAHRDQMTIYGLWAHTKHALPPERIQVHLEYLSKGATQSMALTGHDLEHARGLIRESVGGMAEYLVAGDIRRNQPLPQEDWELSADLGICRHCRFYELCKSELELT